MNEIITLDGYTENSVSVSRSYQEALNIKQGNTAYGVLASLLDNNMPIIDTAAEFLGEFVSTAAVKNVYDKQYFNPKYGKFKNFFTRNIYLDPVKKEKMELARTITGAVTMIGTECAVKWGARGIQYLANEEDKYKTLLRIYQLLYFFSIQNSSNTNVERAIIELDKIRNSFPISQSKISKIRKEVLKKNTKSLSDLDFGWLGEADDSFLENISYLIYSIYCQKYFDVEDNEDVLLEYYNILGYHTNVAKELIKENKNTYITISNDQKKYLTISRAMVNKMEISLPSFDATRIQTHIKQMAKFDPYVIRRKKVAGTAKSGLITIAGLFTENPIMVITAGAEALSQFSLDDNGKEEARSCLKKWGIDEKSISQIFKQSNELKKKTKEIISSNKE